MRVATVPGAEATAWDAEIASQCRQTRNRPASQPAIGAFMKRAATNHDHAGARGRIAACQRDNAFGLNPSDLSGPIGCVGLHVLGEGLKPQSMLGDKLAIIAVFGNDHVHHR